MPPQLTGQPTVESATTPEPTKTVTVNYGYGLTGGLERLQTESAPIVILLDTVHPGYTSRQTANIRRLKMRAEELSGLPCLVIHYSQLPQADMHRANIKAIMINNPVQMINDQLTELLHAFIRETTIPTIGFCGGHHQVYLAYGGTVSNMRLLNEGEKDPNPSYYPGWFKEWGFMPVRILKRDPLFDGLGDEVVVMEQHLSHCTFVPKEFDTLASTDECPVQAIKHREKILYGTQFHPEAYDDDHLDGQVIWRNFFRIAGIGA